MKTCVIHRPWWKTLECSSWATITEITRAYNTKMREAENDPLKKDEIKRAMKMWREEKN